MTVTRHVRKLESTLEMLLLFRMMCLDVFLSVVVK